MKTVLRAILPGTLVALGLAIEVSGATHSVTVQGLTFSPKNLTIAVGDTVTFSGGNNFHTVTGDEVSEPFCGDGLFTTCSVTFSNAGTFGYHCIPHLIRGMIGTVQVVAAVTSPLTVTVHGRGTVLPDLNGQSLLVGGTFTITATPAPGFTFSGWTGGLTSGAPRLTFVMQSNLVLEANFADSTPPSVTVTVPTANARLTNNTVNLQGTASDGNAVAAVDYRVENATGPGSFQPANGTNSWSAVVSNLAVGTNLFHVRARDVAGNVSAEVIRSVLVLTSLTVRTNGNGTVSGGFLGTTFRDPGVRLSILATPKNGFLFSDWTGSIESRANPLSFLAASNMTLQANFVPNPLVPVSGTYNGLFFVEAETNGVRQDRSGGFNFRLLSSGKYSGQLLLAGKRLPFSGQFDSEGKATNAVKRPGTNALFMELMLDLNGGSDQVVGSVSNSTPVWSAELLGDRAPTFSGTNTSAYAGTYTLLVTGGAEAEGTGGAGPPAPELEFGTGFGAVKVDAKGKLTLRGTLADGTPLSQSVPVSKAGNWPLYVPLYGGKGLVFSWVTLTNNAAPEASLYGELSWIKPAIAGAKYYPGGFTNEMDIVGSIYLPPGTNKVLQVDLGTLHFDGGNLNGPLTNAVELLSNNKLKNLTTNQPLVFTITLPTGLFTGSLKAQDGGVNKTLAFKGALLQHQNFGAGFFLGTNESGAAELQPFP